MLWRLMSHSTCCIRQPACHERWGGEPHTPELVFKSCCRHLKGQHRMIGRTTQIILRAGHSTLDDARTSYSQEDPVAASLDTEKMGFDGYPYRRRVDAFHRRLLDNCRGSFRSEGDGVRCHDRGSSPRVGA